MRCNQQAATQSPALGHYAAALIVTFVEYCSSCTMHRTHGSCRALWVLVVLNAFVSVETQTDTNPSDPNERFITIRQNNGVHEYEYCGELIPDFAYMPHYFVNNSLGDLMEPFGAQEKKLSSDCMLRLKSAYKSREKYRHLPRCISSLVPRHCPSVKPSKTQVASLQKKYRREGILVVFIVLLHREATIALASAERILNRSLDIWNARYIFHVDASSSDSLWGEVIKWVDNHSDSAAFVPRDQAIDVEWGDISTITAQMTAMRISLSLWPSLTHVVTISESHIVVSAAQELGNFFSRYAGLSFPGGRPGLVPGNTSVWKYSLNDVTFLCGREVSHIGWRKQPISNLDGYYHGVHLYSFISRDFLNWTLHTKEGQDAVTYLYTRLQYMVTSDEIFWGTLFYNSPYCHLMADMKSYRGFGEEFSAHTWSADCDSTNNQGKELCRSMMHQPMAWWFGTSPQWLQPGDVPLLLSRRPMFARKLRKDQYTDEILRMLDEEKVFHVPTTKFYLSKGLKTKPERRKCLRIVSRDGSYDWVKCDSEGSPVSPATAFALEGCVGHVATRTDDSSGLYCAADGGGQGSCLDHQHNSWGNKSSLFSSSVLSSGFLFGHCRLSTVEEIDHQYSRKYCLSPAVLAYIPNFTQSDDGLAYQDLDGQRHQGESIGFLPCQPDSSVSAVEQLFVFHPDGSIESATRNTLKLDLGIERKKDSSLCVSHEARTQKLKLQGCRKTKTKNKIIPIPIHAP